MVGVTGFEPATPTSRTGKGAHLDSRTRLALIRGNFSRNILLGGRVYVITIVVTWVLVCPAGDAISILALGTC